MMLHFQIPCTVVKEGSSHKLYQIREDVKSARKEMLKKLNPFNSKPHPTCIQDHFIFYKVTMFIVIFTIQSRLSQTNKSACSRHLDTKTIEMVVPQIDHSK